MQFILWIYMIQSIGICDLNVTKIKQRERNIRTNNYGTQNILFHRERSSSGHITKQMTALSFHTSCNALQLNNFTP